MPYNNSLTVLRNELENNPNGLCLYLKTDTNIYSFRSLLTNEQQIDILNPINIYLNEKEYEKYDSLERRVNVIYYITEHDQEFQSLNNIIEMNNQIINNDVNIATIKSIDHEKIKIIIFKKVIFYFYIDIILVNYLNKDGQQDLITKKQLLKKKMKVY